MKTIKLALVLLFSAIISACGGGGDSGLGNSAPTTPLDITVTNHKAITVAALNYAISGSAMGAFSTSDFLKALNETLCAGGGNLIFTPNSFLNFTAGTLTFFNCSDAAGKNFNGTVTFSNFTTSPANTLSNPDTVSARLNFDSLIVTQTSPITLLGEYSLNAAGLNTLSATTTMISPVGTSLKLNSNITETISNFNMSNVLNTGINASDNNDFTLASSSLGGQVSGDTTTPFVISSNKIFPNSGVLIITSTLNSNQLRVTALGDETASSQVKVELSTNGGSIYNAPVLYTWADLFPPP